MASTPIQVNLNKIYNASTDTTNINAYNEDSSLGSERIGKLINYESASTPKKSGVTHVYSPQLPATVFSSSIKIDIESRLVQGISVKNARDLLGDLLPFIYMGDREKVYNFNSRERFSPFVNFDNYGVHELIKKHEFFPYHDISTIKNNSKNYLQVTNYVDTKIYPKHSGSGYDEIIGKNAVIEPFDIRSTYPGRNPAFNSTSDRNTNLNRGYFTGISCEIAGGTDSLQAKGCQIITDLIEVAEKQTHNGLIFDDTKQPPTITTLIKSTPAFSRAKDTSVITPYNDSASVDYSNGKITAYFGSAVGDIIAGKGIMTPYSRNSEIGTRYRSATAGFVYGRTHVGGTSVAGTGANAVPGTDSIAFGGLIGDVY